MNRIIALEIGADRIDMAVFAHVATGAPQLLDSGSVEISAEGAEGLPREAVVAMALKRLMAGHTPKTKRTYISIEGSAVFSRLVKLPKVGKDQLQKTIHHEAIQNIPFPIDEVVWDAHVVDPGSPEPEILLVAAKLELVEGLVHAVRANGLSVERVSVAPVALANAARLEHPASESVLLVDAGLQTTNLIFIDGARTFFRALPMVGSDAERLVQEIERSIAFFSSQQQGNAPERILLRGKSIRVDQISDRFSLPVVSVGDVACSVCAGLVADSAVSINLIPHSVENEQKFKKRQPLWFASALVLLMLVGVWVVNLDLQIRQAGMATVEVKKQIADLSRIELQQRPIEEKTAQLNHRADVYQTALEQRTFWLEVFGELSRLLPEGMFLLSSEPIHSMGHLTGTRISVVSYLDKEPQGQDVVKRLRDTLRSSDLFNDQTKVFSRPSKKLFAREFVLDVYFAGGGS